MILLGKSRLPAHERLIGLNHDVSGMGADARPKRGRTTEHQSPFQELETAPLPSHRGGTRSLPGELAPDRWPTEECSHRRMPLRIKDTSSGPRCFTSPHHPAEKEGGPRQRHARAIRLAIKLERRFVPAT